MVNENEYDNSTEKEWVDKYAMIDEICITKLYSNIQS